MARIRPRERAAIIQSLRAGVTPRVGLEHIQVGRVNEVKAMIEELERVCNGGSTFKVVVGDFGAGKSFFLQLVRYLALEKGMVVVNADLAPDRRLQASGGQARSLYQELMRNMATRAHPEGNAIVPVIEKFITTQITAAEETGESVESVIKKRLHSLSELVDGFDFAQVVARYYEGYDTGNDDLKQSAIRYLRGEYATRTEARSELGVRGIVTDSSIYDHLKLMARFVCQAGYKGLLVNLDEMVNLYKLPSSRSRSANYEQILRILNDCLQGTAENIGFMLGGTTDFLCDTRKGLYSYEALRSRLAENTFAEIANVVDYHGPVLKLENLSPEELFVLLSNIRNVFANGDESRYLLPDEALTAFLRHCSQNIGESYFRTPRNTIKAFVDLLSVIEQNPEIKWESLISGITLENELDPSLVTLNQGHGSVSNDSNDDDELVTFQL
ncbi:MULTISPECIES: ATP-binding protein [unclassified Anaerobiospirillum]|uniref:ATP-binding protein n=1 Tax=unclassified Anaerobiospirillum TaxID=2647410 RepID=UPI001FF28214|nr:MULTISPECIES: ATP-binding protein [unclassified Anaerobiospirillum]MCK0534407.1 ATP-binding protein [Anaerobiospirillum sp. NML120511]MCK0539795.1 ATP-binding protein [Anaerobiospirillum sp. NML02-A-032]